MNGMPPDIDQDLCYHLGAFRFTPSRNELRNSASEQILEPRLVALLKLLCDAQGRTVSREEIMERVWKGIAVTDLSITRAVSDLRKFLSDDGKKPQIIGTVRKVGYRLLIPVTTTPVAPAELPSDPAHKSLSKPRSRFLLPAFMLLSLVLVTLYFLPSKGPARHWELVPVAVSGVNETASSIANDGQQVAFSKEIPGGYELWHWRADTGEKQRVYTSEYPILETVWAPDSQRIIYCAWNQTKLEVYQIFARPGAVPTKFAEMPIGMLLGITLADEDHLILSMARDGSDYVLHQVNLKTGESRVFLEPEEGDMGLIYPKISPDGSKLAFCYVEDPSNVRLAVCDRDGKNLVLYDEGRSFYDLDWVDDQDIGFISMRTYKPELYLKNLNSKTLERTNLDGFPVSIEFAENLVMDHANMDIDVVTYHLEHGLTRMTDSVLSEFDAAFARHTDKLAFVTNENNRFQVIIREEPGKNTIVPFEGHRLASPRWNHAATQLAFLDQGSIGDRVFLFDLASQNVREVFTHRAIANISGYSQDDQIIFCRLTEPEFKGIVALTLDGQIAAKYPHAWKIVPTPEALYFNRLDDPHLWKIVAGSEAEKVMSMPLNVGSSWDLYEGQLIVLDRLNRLQGFDLVKQSMLFTKTLDYSLYPIGNLTAIDGQTFCFDFPKNTHGDVYFGELRDR